MSFEVFREQFQPARENRVYLLHCGVSPLPRCSASRMTEVIERFHRMGNEDYVWMEAGVAKTRAALARLIHANVEEIAFTRNTTDGVAWVANGLNLQPGDRVISAQGEYPATIYPFMRLQQKGIDFHLLQPVESRITAEQIAQAITPSTKLVVLSWVQFTTGFRADLKAIASLCNQHDIPFLVDAIQGLGALELNCHETGIAFATCGAQKWMMGPQGVGFFYCRKDWLDRIELTHPGSDSVTSKVPYLEYDYTLRPDSQRFEYGTLPTFLILGMGASVEMMLDAGPAAIEEHILSLTDTLIEGLTPLGFICHSPRDAGQGSGIVSFTHPDRELPDCLSLLHNAGCFALEREGYLRLAPHFYQTHDEMRRVVAALS